MHVKIEIEKKTYRKILTAALTGAGAGFINGFLGAGAGILLMFMAAAVNSDKSESATGDNFATVVACVLPLSVVSVIIYSIKGSVDLSLAGRFAIPAVIGGLLGAFLTDKLKAGVLRTVFAVVVIIAGVNMMF